MYLNGTGNGIIGNIADGNKLGIAFVNCPNVLVGNMAHGNTGLFDITGPAGCARQENSPALQPKRTVMGAMSAPRAQY
jgi:parallel beta-helix repeat protein